MPYHLELELTRRILRNFHIQSHIMEWGQPVENIDFGLRSYLGMEHDYKTLFLTPCFATEHNTIYNVADLFLCNYVFLRLPDTGNSFLIIGPYTHFAISKEMLLETAEAHNLNPMHFAQLEKYYENIPIAKDDLIASITIAFGESLWKGIDNFTVQHMIHGMAEDPLLLSPSDNYQNQDNPLISAQILEYRYEGENKLIKAVSQGALQKAELIIGGNDSPHSAIEKRVADPLRNIKNYTIVLNTLLRKAAEVGSVHPLHIDNLSSLYARKIEDLPSVEAGYALQKDMVSKYCRLVKNHSMKKYSLLVQKVLTHIDLDLTADLSLKSQAELLNINASYLSTLFKKETGKTLTDYVNERRVRYACTLLQNTNLQIQTIAQQCGILDLNYFTKTFKKYMSMTPKEYRESIPHTHKQS